MRSPPSSPVVETPDLSVIVVNVNGVEWLRRCLASIRQTQGSLNLQVILVDNGSTDGSVEAAREAWPRLISRPQGRNIGYVRANNVGLREARAPYVMLLNNDTEFLPGCLAELVRFLDEHPEAGAISGQILNPDGSDQGTARRFPTIANALFGRRSRLSHWFPNNPWTRRYMVGRFHIGDEPFEVEMLSSACMVVRTSLATQLGGLDEAFELYWVDAELCHRVRAAGYRVYCVPRAKLIHFEGHGGSTRTWRQRVRATISFHQGAYLAYVKIHGLSPLHPRRLLAAGGLSARLVCMMMLQLLRPSRATTSGGRN